ncbi:MAG: hypothetical protein ACE5DQ_01780, partial [Candidatus Paceibacterota bacterium]
MISEQFLPLLMEDAFPNQVKHRASLVRLARPSERIKNHKQRGVWLIKEPNDDLFDEAGWFVIHWPSLLRRIISNPRSRNKLYELGYHDCKDLLPRKDTPPDEFFVQCSIFKRRFERYLPPGAALWSYDAPFQRLTSFIPEKENDKD